MFKSIQIRGYRGFADFEMGDLGRVNLLVGKNNSGKTSALEGLYLLASRGQPYSVWSVLWRRGERLPERNQENYPEIDICHLFHGHESQVGTKFTLSAQNETPSRSLTFSIGEISDPSRGKPTTQGGIPIPGRLALIIKGSPAPELEIIPLSRSGGMSSESLEPTRRPRRASASGDEMPTRFITAESVSGDELVALWDKVTLTSHEERVYVALRFLEPGVERIAAQASRHYYAGNERGGFLVKMKGNDRPLPIGSMGDGMWRIMALAIAIAQCKDGVLLVDEIDTGLHYSVMTDMWKLIFGAAKELNVQIFATTHSDDCVKSLAQLCFASPDAATEVTLQRIERGKRKAVPYTAGEIETAAVHGIEVR